MFEDGDFEVVDECTGEDDAPEVLEKVEQKDGSKPAEEKTNGAEKPAATATKGILKKTASSTPNKPDPSKGSNGDSIDFTADVSMEQDNPKDETVDDGGDDGVIQIDVTDTIMLDSEECEAVTDATSISENDGKPAEASESTDVEVVAEILPEHAWYEEKINGKFAIAKERLSKLARVLEFSYPTYKPWLEHFKDPVCHLEPPRRCPLTRPHSNRWKFICSRKPVQESTNKEEDSAEGTVNKKVETVWRLGPTDGSGINTDNASQYPPFVMRVVKVFEEFIQNVEQTAEPEPEPAEPIKEEAAAAATAAAPEAKADDTAVPEVKAEDASTPKATPEVAAAPEGVKDDATEDDENKEEANDEKDTVIDRNHNWLWLLVRSNSKDELMVFATGKKISQATMEKLKETFETGPGKDCNVKSLYCKSIAKNGTSTTTNITFLGGSEALDETVGGLKVQLAPKTNFWCNAAGVEQLGAAVGDLLTPVQKFTVAEIGCGLGLIGLMQASKCRQVIGLDAPSEVEEAEMTSELNQIKNSSFVMGTPNDMMTQITKLLKNSRSAAIVNANTKIGRTIEMMTALRKIPTLRRVVMITTLTKQSVRAILELTRPADGDLGNPFMPVRAVMVDTLPVGPHFEVVIRMERLTMHKMSESWFWNHVQFRAGLTTQGQQQKGNAKKNDKAGNSPKVQATKAGVKGAGPAKGTTIGQSANKRANNRANKRNKLKKQAQLKAAGQGVVVGSRIVVGPGLVTGVVKNAPKNLVKNPLAGGAKGQSRNQGRNQASNAGKSPLRGKRAHSPDKNNATGAKRFARNNRSGTKPLQSNKLSPDSPNQQQANRVVKSNKPKVASPLKKNPLARVPPRGGVNGGAQKRRRNWGPEGPNMRGQPMPGKRMRDNQNHNDDLRARLSEGRMDPALLQQVQEQQMLLSLAQQKLTTQGPVVDVDTAKQLHNMLNIVLEQTNKLQNQLPRSNVWDRIAPLGNSGYNSPPQNADRDMAFRERYVQDMGPQDMVITAQNRGFMQQNQQGPMPLFPANRMPLEPHQVAPAGMTPAEFMRGRGMPERSSGGRDFRKPQFQGDNWQRQNQFEKNRAPQQAISKQPPVSTQAETMRGTSPKRSLLSPPRLEAPATRRYNAPAFAPAAVEPLRRPLSSPRRQMSPPRRQMSPPRTQSTEIFHRRPAASQGGRQQQQQSSNAQRRGNSPQRQRDLPAAGRSNSPFKKFGDEWDIPNRSTLERSNWQGQQGQQQNQQQQRSGDRNAQDKRWADDRPSNSQNWDNSASNDRFRKMDQDKWVPSGGGGGDAWNSKQSSMKAGSKDQWSQGMMNKPWGGGGSGPSSGDNWNMRGKEGYGQSSRMDGWGNSKKGDKEDWSDLPEDARDPWGDDGGQSNSKQRWQQGADRASASNWGRDNDKMDQNWSNKSSGNWQNKGSSSMGGNKPEWSNMGNQNTSEQRWMSQNDAMKKSMSSGNWQGNSNNAMSNWRPQNYQQGFPSQQQRQNVFGSNNYKGGR